MPNGFARRFHPTDTLPVLRHDFSSPSEADDMISLKKEPTPWDLRVFAVLQLPFCAFGLTKLIHGVPSWAVIGGVAASSVIAAVGAISPQRIVRIYRGWMRIVSPIGWCVSYGLLAATFYLILTPIGLMMRLAGHDPLHRRPNAGTTFWEERPPAPPADHYLRQF